MIREIAATGKSPGDGDGDDPPPPSRNGAIPTLHM
jgi:hypothetical protein